MLELHPARCEWCDTPVRELLQMVEEYVESPEGKVDLATEEVKAINASTERKQEAWGF